MNSAFKSEFLVIGLLKLIAMLLVCILILLNTCSNNDISNNF